MSRRAHKGVFHVSVKGRDVQCAHAERLLLSGWDAPSVAVQTGLSLEDMRAIAAAVSADDFTSGAAPP